MDRNETLENVLLEFSIAHPLPTDDEVAAAVVLHPEHANAIRDHAAEAIGEALDKRLGEDIPMTEERERAIMHRARELTRKLAEQSRAAGHDVVAPSRSMSKARTSDGWRDR